jgi:hypothetical protein
VIRRGEEKDRERREERRTLNETMSRCPRFFSRSFPQLYPFFSTFPFNPSKQTYRESDEIEGELDDTHKQREMTEP